MKNLKEFEKYQELHLDKFKEDIKTPLKLMQSIIKGQINPLLRNYKENYHLDFSEVILDEIVEVLEL